MQKPQSYAKSVSSSYSSVMRNGEEHSKGKQIINNSTKPFIQIDEMLDGQVHHYMVPKNTIPYTQPMQMSIQRQNQMPMSMTTQRQIQKPKL